MNPDAKWITLRCWYYFKLFELLKGTSELLQIARLQTNPQCINRLHQITLDYLDYSGLSVHITEWSCELPELFPPRFQWEVGGIEGVGSCVSEVWVWEG